MKPIVFDDYGSYEIALLRVGATPSIRGCDTWAACAEVLTPLVTPAAACEVTLDFLGARRKGVSRGKAKWSAESFATWCIPDAGGESAAPDHLRAMEANRPTWTKCLAQRLPPEAFVSVTWNGALDRSWEHALLLASRTGVDVVALAAELARILDVVAAHAVRGPFAEPGLVRRGKAEGMSYALQEWSGTVPPGKTWKKRKISLARAPRPTTSTAGRGRARARTDEGR